MPNLKLERAILKIRPAILGAFLKKFLRIPRRTIQTTLGFSFWVDPVSLFGAELIEKGSYEPKLADSIQALLKPGDTFFDIGANEGYFAVIGSASVKNGGKVFLVEPQSRLQPVIKENLSINGCKNVEMVPMVFSDKEGTVNFNLSTSVSSGNSSLYKPSLFVTKESVTSTTLDHFVSNRSIAKIRFIKLDCEGAEFLMLSGAKEVLKQQMVEFISVDYHPYIVGQAVVRKIDALLRANNYLLTETGNGNWFYHLPAVKNDLVSLRPLKEIAPL